MNHGGALCERLGARTVHPDELTVPVMPHDMVDASFDVALECSGNNHAMESALAQLKRAGTLVLVGAGIRRPKFDNNRILLNELVITGAYVYDHDGFPRCSSCLCPAGCRSTSWSKPRTTRSTGCSMPRSASTKAGSGEGDGRAPGGP